jgi:hypothetical protein
MLCSYYIFSSAQSNQAVAPGYEFWNPAMQAIAKPNSKPGWIYFKDDFSTPPVQIFTVHKEAFGLGLNDSMYLFKQKTDELGIQHFYLKRINSTIEIFNSAIHLVIRPDGTKYLSGMIKLLQFNEIVNYDENYLQNLVDTLSNPLHFYIEDSTIFYRGILFNTIESGMYVQKILNCKTLKL